jgi:hypothetical protein
MKNINLFSALFINKWTHLLGLRKIVPLKMNYNQNLTQDYIYIGIELIDDQSWKNFITQRLSCLTKKIIHR